MNIIKFKDTIVDDRTKEKSTWYNNHLRGKYAYWIRCHVVVSLESITQYLYKDFEKNINNLFGYEFYIKEYDGESYSYVNISDDDISYNAAKDAVLMNNVPQNPTSSSPQYIKLDLSTIEYVDLQDERYSWMEDYIDETETDIVNRVDVYKQYNNYVLIDDVPMDELRRFRTWLATTLLDINYSFYKWIGGEYVLYPDPSLDERFDAIEVTELPTENKGIVKIHNLDIENWTDNDSHILEYYKNGMYDDTIKWISIFGGVSTKYGDSLIKNNCGCNTNISSLYQDNISICDMSNIYRNKIKSSMIELFSNVDTWSVLPTSYLSLMKKYVDDIIYTNLGFTIEDSSNYYGCECINKSSQERAISILKQLSTSLSYIIDGESNIKKYKNYITSSLYQWSSELYELMEWK